MRWQEELERIDGTVGAYCHMAGREPIIHQGDSPITAASVIKLPILVEGFRAIREGALDPNELFVIKKADKMPSCGALAYMHDGLAVTVRDLLTLMIILSDNTATNLLIDRLGVSRINDTMEQLGIPGICLRRRLFDGEASRKGIENTVTARGIGLLLERLETRELLGDPWDGEMLQIMLNQRLNGKMPFYLHSRGVRIAHKTGEDDGITHDVGIIYAKEPVILCLLSERVDVPAFERLIQNAALECWQAGEGDGK